MLYRFLRVFVKVFIRPLFRLELRGTENLPEDNGFILCANHWSNWDPVFIAIMMTWPIRFMGKKELFTNPLLGGFLRKLGVFPINREGRDLKSMKYAIGLVNDNQTLGIFPEGTRVDEISRSNLKEGVSYIALKAKCDLVPIEIISSYKPFQKTIIKINKPIKIDQYLSLKSKEAMKDITDEIYKGIYQSRLS
ncbi:MULTISPECIES: 1-acyl-sn-glycerol-3-phosphate acyltransferase [Anaerococcus]|uniref:1-acyl-sn-glycerol-3-phosphate acyltransferase n=2 Tax=Peptoniphilaceae TaxID=1570339 RepID=A0A3E2TIG0_9FIRM|nr:MULTISPECIES: lysophospholipid acyltransferase family protein [Anaerococcus]MBP2069601.1 1-acyl-sn-glycerol-3-phosphate acyltransferase [Anaerococcus nagyae]MDU1828419.1 lysophospholipid acyltransferase family protein [Anaerococcus sp.]MDU1864088.1 lysophospholipid acyltransferase family protein [Anaerococcus sp.]MDU2353923.1 lysophospholipid acyltransferase family protein [Anaerococcus sp.]MDU2565453.1 lysophospholipid acyltransferase family protein [Anaerococcus sp.]